jgi:hypothetical protein
VAIVAAGGAALLLGVLQYRQVARVLGEHGDPLPLPRWPAMTAAIAALLGIVAIGVYLVVTTS